MRLTQLVVETATVTDSITRGTIVRIGGVDVTHRVTRHPNIDMGLSRRGLARLTLIDREGMYRPPLFEDCEVEIEGQPLWAGTIMTVRASTAVDATGFMVDLEIQDYDALTERLLYNGPTPAGTLKDAVIVAANGLAVFGVTLDPDMDTGPTIPAIGFSFRTIREVLDAITAVADPPYGWRIDAYKVLHVTTFGTRPAPWELSGTTARVLKVNWETTQRKYRNHQWVHFGEPGVRAWTTTWVGDGSRRDFSLIGPNIQGELWPAGDPPIPHVLVNAVSFPVGNDGDTSVDWWYIPAPSLLIRQNPAAAVLTASDTLQIPFTGMYPGAVFESTSPTADPQDTVVAIDIVPNTDDPAAARAAALRLLQRYSITPKTATIETGHLGFEPGMSVTINLPPWDLSGTWLIDGVQLRHELMMGNGKHYWRTQLSIIEGGEGRGSWLDFWRTRAPVTSGTAFSGVATT